MPYAPAELRLSPVALWPSGTTAARAAGGVEWTEAAARVGAVWEPGDPGSIARGATAAALVSWTVSAVRARRRGYGHGWAAVGTRLGSVSSAGTRCRRCARLQP